MITRFNMTRDINGYNGFGLKFTNSKYSGLLLAGVEQIITVPSTKESTYANLLAVFSFDAGANVWVSLNEVAEVAAGSLSETTSELNPAARYVQPGDEIHLISSDTSTATGVIFYAAT